MSSDIRYILTSRFIILCDKYKMIMESRKTLKEICKNIDNRMFETFRVKFLWVQGVIHLLEVQTN